MSKLIYNESTGEVVSLLQSGDVEKEAKLLKLNTPPNHAVMDAPGVQSPNGIVIDITGNKHKIKEKP